MKRSGYKEFQEWEEFIKDNRLKDKNKTKIMKQEVIKYCNELCPSEYHELLHQFDNNKEHLKTHLKINTLKYFLRYQFSEEIDLLTILKYKIKNFEINETFPNKKYIIKADIVYDNQ